LKSIIEGENIISPSLKGKNFRELDDSISWRNPLFNSFFDSAKINPTAHKTDLLVDAFEFVCALILLVLFAPIMIATAIAIRFSSKGSVFYKQIRVGKNGKHFNIYKFRSMIQNAEVHTGITLSWEGDPRITKLGEFLRKSHIDELPQLLNILKGEMSFIGPRPERPEFTDVYVQDITNYRVRENVKPGITGLAQIACVYDAKAPDKLKYDLLYILHKDSYLLNLLIAWYTAKKMLFLKGTAELV
jgi:lipopolysaccharide/colanic/teichoic acid biosynthesis glycosyltransferase